MFTISNPMNSEQKQHIQNLEYTLKKNGDCPNLDPDKKTRLNP